MNLSLAKFSHLCPSSQLESGGDNITGKWWSFFPPGCASQRTIHPSFLSPVMCAYIASANKICKSLIFLTSERAAQPVTNKPLPCSRLPTLFFQASSHLLSAYPNPCSGFFLAFQKSSGHNSATGLNHFLVHYDVYFIIWFFLLGLTLTSISFSFFYLYFFSPSGFAQVYTYYIHFNLF